MTTAGLLKWSLVICLIASLALNNGAAMQVFWLYVAGMSGCIAALAAVTLMVNGLANTLDWMQE